MKIQTRLDTKQRNNLGEILPLNTPYVLLVDPSNICNIRCKWCPSGHDDLISLCGREQKLMSIKQFEKIVEQTKEFDEKIKVLRLYKEGEPLLNPNFSQMIRMAKESKSFERIDTTTNGLLFRKELNRKIIDAGIDQINISVNGVNEEQIYKNTGRKIDFENYVENIKDLYINRGNCTIYIKSIKDILNEEEQKKFYDIFGEISDRIYLERLSPAWPEFDVENSGYTYKDIGNYGQKTEERKVCPYLFYIMVINSNGTVSTCVGDWKHIQLSGNIENMSLKQIWLGNMQRKYWLEHLSGNRDVFEMCKNCKVITHGCYDNIDEYALQIKEKIENNCS